MHSAVEIDSNANKFRRMIVRGSRNTTDTAAVDGYFVNLSTRANSQFVQIFYLKGFWGFKSGGNITQYIGGWISPGTIESTNIKVSFLGNNCYIYDGNEYISNPDIATKITVSLTNSGQHTPYTSGNITAVGWSNSPDAFKVADLTVDRIV